MRNNTNQLKTGIVFVAITECTLIGGMLAALHLAGFKSPLIAAIGLCTTAVAAIPMFYLYDGVKAINHPVRVMPIEAPRSEPEPKITKITKPGTDLASVFARIDAQKAREPQQVLPDSDDDNAPILHEAVIHPRHELKTKRITFNPTISVSSEGSRGL